MSEKNEPWDALITENYTHNGEDKTKFHRVGVAFQNSKQGFDVIFFEGISVSGRVTILPRLASDREAADTSA